MAPDTIEVRAILENRALKRGLKKFLPDKTINPDFLDATDPRGIPPMLIEETIKETQPIVGKNPGTREYVANNIKIVLNETGSVITVHPYSKRKT
jgi:hypothetical protein